MPENPESRKYIGNYPRMLAGQHEFLGFSFRMGLQFLFSSLHLRSHSLDGRLCLREQEIWRRSASEWVF